MLGCVVKGLYQAGLHVGYIDGVRVSVQEVVLKLRNIECFKFRGKYSTSHADCMFQPGFGKRIVELEARSKGGVLPCHLRHMDDQKGKL